VQTCVAAQVWQAPPLPPHADAPVPDWQRPSMSQHPGQFCALQPVATHTPPLFGPAGAHCEPVHASHACPPVPQTSSSVPPTHPLAEQHPAQLSGPHELAAHWPPPWAAGRHEVPVPHGAHSLPLSPHAVSLVPTSQTVPVQQPAHVPHGDGATQSPFESHVSPAGQLQGEVAWQAPPPSGCAAQTAGTPACVQSPHTTPPTPHAWSAVPATHAPFAQHPLHVDGLHCPPPSTSMKVVVPSKSDERPHPTAASAASVMSTNAIEKARAIMLPLEA
jgi:hypothetical protein